MTEVRTERKEQIFNEFKEGSRFDYPEGIVNVTIGLHGGEATLIKSGEKTVLHDCGMAYCAPQIIENLKKELGGRPLDYILVSHTHYDHIGALPYIKKAFPEATVCGSAYAQYVFTRPGAHRVMKELGIAAAKLYGNGDEEIITDGMAVDLVMKDGDKLDLGGKYIVALETKGHTDCAMTFVLEPDSVMFTSESTGVCAGPDNVNVAILKSFDDSIASAEKCKAYGPKRIISPHFGIIPENHTQKFLDMFKEKAYEEKEYVVGMWNMGLTPEEMLEKATKDVFEGGRGEEQPYEAFVANTKVIIQLYEQYADPEKKYNAHSGK